MANMSYCRFGNTLSDFDDCLQAMREDYNIEKNLSPQEAEAMRELLDNVVDMALEFGDLIKRPVREEF